MTPTARRESAALPPGAYDIDCVRCPRLAAHLGEVRREHPTYFCRPVSPFGDPRARLVIVGLAPGKHGANATGRPFTGDYAGILLYRTLYDFGFASEPESLGAADSLHLVGARITNAVKCLPPGNKPLPSEIHNCNDYLAVELSVLPEGAAILALGRIAHDAVLRALALRRREHPFAHGARHALPRGVRLFDSYHCSRYNANTGRITAAMFRRVFRAIVRHLDPERSRARAA
ncbi:MAG TPA: uracil-DNA glycosylase [Casimicrobiaceae bacterium]|nr:uracil-DNA glycosylase [Casimicrobiaceae bacterium]